jgi:hypothetical protein
MAELRSSTKEVSRALFVCLREAYANLQRSIDARTISWSTGATIIFPTILIVTETRSSVIYELVGATETFRSLRVIHQKCVSNALYFGQFEEHEDSNTAGAFTFLYPNYIRIQDLALVVSDDIESALERFPFMKAIESLPSVSLQTGRSIYVGDDAHGLTMNDMYLVNQNAGELRAKFIVECGILDPNCSSESVKEIAGQRTSDALPIGVRLAWKGEAQRLQIAGQFTALFLSPFVHEPRLGVFLQEHPEFVHRALGTTAFLSEKTFEWQGSRRRDRPIRPDLLVRRQDGTYDIYDLKTALLSRNVTRRARERRMFAPDLEEGLAQLAHYHEYFSSDENREYLSRKYGIRVNDPKLVLVAGHQTNTNPQEVQEALRRVNIHSEQFAIISYDALVLAFLAESWST